MPDHHGAWFAQRVIEVKLEYGLTVDPAERDALEALLGERRRAAELHRLNWPVSGGTWAPTRAPRTRPGAVWTLCQKRRRRGSPDHRLSA